MKNIGVPLVSVILFFVSWSLFSSMLYNIEATRKIEKVRTDQGEAAAKEMEDCIAAREIACRPNALPSPSDVWAAAITLWNDHQMIAADRAAFEEKTKAINENLIASGKATIKYTGRPSFIDQIFTSLGTVFAGFLLAAFIAIPIGVAMGLSPTFRLALNWGIQIFKPVSPVVWFLLVFMIVKTIAADWETDKSFVISFIAVGLCSMWATLVNTAVGVSNVHPDYINVSKVLRLSVMSNVFKVVLPASIPLIFTGLRITMSVAWMVLIAIELLAQNPGLGTFVWEQFQNGANDSNAKIIVAMFIIGIIGFGLDRLMGTIQQLASFDDKNDSKFVHFIKSLFKKEK